MPQVTIVGAGIAGLTAALRLVERGFAVTLFEQSDLPGGSLSARSYPPAMDYYEHSYHMYLNWYHNFWQIVDEVGIRDCFIAQPTCHFLQRHRAGAKPIALRNVGSFDTSLANMFSGLRSPPDMFLYGYSLLDLLATPSRHTRLDNTGVFAFMHGRPYMTPQAVTLHGETLVKAFACPNELTSTRSYRSFIHYGYRQPDPMMWLLRGNTHQYLFEPLLAHIHSVASKTGGSLDLRFLHRVVRLRLDADRLQSLEVAELKPAVGEERSPEIVRRYQQPAGDAVIVAVFPAALGALVDHQLFVRARELANVRKLHSQPMASIDVYFKRKLPNIPQGITVLLDSEFQVTFLDNSQTWDLPQPSNVTFLNVVISDFQVLEHYRSPSDREYLQNYIFNELKQYIDFHFDPDTMDDDIDRERCHLQMNIGEPLFTNQVGSRRYRPQTTCSIPNLFIAGDFCQTFVDITTIESAVVSGLMAADAARRLCGDRSPIEIIRPTGYPRVLVAAMRSLGLPAAYGAKAYRAISAVASANYKEYFPND